MKHSQECLKSWLNSEKKLQVKELVTYKKEV